MIHSQQKYVWAQMQIYANWYIDRSYYLLLQPDDRGPFLFEEAGVLFVHLAGHVGLPLEVLQRLVVPVAEHVLGDRLVELLSLPL